MCKPIISKAPFKKKSSLYLQNKEILFTGHTVSVLLGVQQHLPTHTSVCGITLIYFSFRYLYL